MSASVFIEKLSWRMNRLRCMSVMEVGYRLQSEISSTLQRYAVFQGRVPKMEAVNKSVPWISADIRLDPRGYCQIADQILEGRFDLLALEQYQAGFPPKWNVDPLSGRAIPQSYWKEVDYKNPATVADIKYLWELNRHLHLVTLAQAYYLTKELRYLNALAINLKSWFEQCPYLKGPNWTSALELGIRLINWSLCWQLVGGEASPMFNDAAGRQLRTQWLNAIYQHSHYISQNFSRYSSANNHLIGEAAGLFIASVMWPLWKQSAKWREKAKDILSREALLQNTSDGVNKEQSTAYQQFVLDFLLFSGLVARANGCDFDAAYWSRIEKMLEYIASIMDVEGNVPMIGDADDALVAKLSPEPNWSPYRSLLACGAVLFDRADFKFKAGRVDDKTLWLLGENARIKWDALRENSDALALPRSFPEGGYYILGSDFESRNEIKLMVDAGPLGYQRIAAHGHADALSFSLSIGGVEFLVDPGTYIYHGSSIWRNYFRGTSAHNTVRIDKQDQSLIGGSFMWLHKATARCEAWESGEDTDRFAGTHDGYQRLSDPVLHRREIVLDKKRRRVIATDLLECRGTHIVELFWHFSEHCTVQQNSDGISIENADRKMNMTFENQYDLNLTSGDNNLPAGWVSRRYGIKTASPTIISRMTISGTARFVTTLECV